MATLYELTDDYMHLLSLMEDVDADEEAIADTLEGLDYELEIKAENYAKIMKELEGQAEMIKGEIKRLTDKKSKLEDNIKRLKDTLQEAMVLTNKKKFKTELFSFNIQKNGGALPVIVDVDTADLPDELVIIDEKPNLKALAKYLEDHPDTKYGHFGERGESLRIK